MPTVSTGRGTGTRKVKKASAWAGSKYKKAQARKMSEEQYRLEEEPVLEKSLLPNQKLLKNENQA